MKRRPFLCWLGLHWPLNRKSKVVSFYDYRRTRKHRVIYICQCPCGKYWLAEHRYGLFKIPSGRHWLHVCTKGEELPNGFCGHSKSE